MEAATATATLRILVGDDQADVLEALRLLLKGAGHKAVMVDSPAALLRASQAEPFDLILMDLNYARDTTSGQEGLDLLNRLHAQNNEAPIVVMTAWGNIELAVEAMRRGASDFIQKPWDNTKLLEAIHKQSRRREKSELELARHVQQNLFPKQLVHSNTLECAGKCIPAREVSGDYYDFIDLGQDRTAFALADVSGKGMAAALLMASLQASLRSQSMLVNSGPVGLLNSVNILFYDSTPPEHYATLFYGQYDDVDRMLTYVNCGHLAPVIVRGSGEIERLDPTATVMGLFKMWDGEQGQIRLMPGDLVAIFSDGITEAGIDMGQDYGEDRLIALLRTINGQPLGRSLDQIIDSVERFSGGQQNDDMTLILLRAN